MQASMKRYVSVVGAGEATAGLCEAAREAGHALAAQGVVIVTGGLGGVMSAAAEGAAAAGGLSLGLLPGSTRGEGNPHSTMTLPTGMGELRNGLVVRAADVVLAIGGSWGTLSEIALALRTGVPVVTYQSWKPAQLESREDVAAQPNPGIQHAETLSDAVEMVWAHLDLVWSRVDLADLDKMNTKAGVD
ncbi:MAG: TIGR00725 family protein [Nocardioidaceae bacterium]